eukprot:CAMPEP_0194275264 /NCGR_PEP_ID=MMETSP0169-20130528/8153_1 /TAXON_ID=218684 /ORGANISM="Corethron pennatum, Strain L29A3" /LENGTH=221 /DNA_ID=CAMNT_0039018687 /DNA_START=162 /DNA_END=823 /DNA_ORIENTATION=-
MLAPPPLHPSSVSAPAHPNAQALRLISLLTEPSPELRRHALTALLPHLDSSWHLVADRLPDLEACAEDPTDPGADAAAAVASRVYFHLGEMMDALRLALRTHGEAEAGRGPYWECVRSAAVGLYVSRGAAAASGAVPAEEEDADAASEIADGALLPVVDAMFRRCYARGDYAEAVGVALEARDAVRAREALEKAASPSVLRYALEHVAGVPSRAFRDGVVA